ncbi:MAG: thiamine pyrophosphate-dependent enzyme [Thermoanaerobaculaceae bacterium]
MNEAGFCTAAKDPWCPGCGHTPLVRALQRALARRLDPAQVVLVTDIGCIGMADAMFTCHTVHGLHGRAPALAAGIALSAPRMDRKVVVLMGDGGAAIGLQHLMECARLNVDVTVVVGNNQNYGMTGGQHSAFTLPGVKTTTTPGGSREAPYLLCEVLAPLGVRRARVSATDSAGLGRELDAALAHRGFSLVEVLEYCPAYAGKSNPGELTPKTIESFFSDRGMPPGAWEATTSQAPYRFEPAPRDVPPTQVVTSYRHDLDRQVNILLAGSAGEGVQSSAEIFATAAIRSGVEVVVRGEYPVTVGKGFSAASIVLSPEPILTPVALSWDIALVTSADGARWLGERVDVLREIVWDASLERPVARGEAVDFRRHGARQASLAAMVWLLETTGWFPMAALRETVLALPGQKARDTLLGVLPPEAH